MVLGYGYLWCDTNCIDKSSSAELTEAINSMFDWYALSGACLAYLDDVPSQGVADPRSAFCGSRWFTRGWTLQELLAPPDVRFYDKNWAYLGLRSAMTDQVTRATGIHATFLEPTTPVIAREKLDGASIAMRMSWVSTRETTRAEDLAYCMLGIFGINMPLLYGEGTKAFQRLQEEIIRATNDMTLFCWHWDDKYVPSNWQSILAPSPRVFTDCGGYRERFEDNHDLTPYTITNAGLSIRLPTISVGPFVLALLHVSHPGPMVYHPKTASWPVHIPSHFSYGPATQFALLLLHPEHLNLATEVYVRSQLPPMPVPQHMYYDIRTVNGELRSRSHPDLEELKSRDMHIAFRPTHLRARRVGVEQETYGLSQHDLDFEVGVMFMLSSSIPALPATPAAKNILALKRDDSSGWFLSILPITSKRYDMTCWIGFAASDIELEQGAPRRRWFSRCLGYTRWLRDYDMLDSAKTRDYR
ncbi:hypothetical protein GE09DRAFT_679835 [Coniochaeta sp. 2T2.1]|nr:hypothetical protein GE09DRAFT_679835 [Coniochaeta sp. 2T2.1]